jgi:uncharacterized protein (TIGR03435 family)
MDVRRALSRFTLSVAAVATLSAQAGPQDAGLQFDVVSVKLNTSDSIAIGGGGEGVVNGRLTILNVGLPFLISNAFLDGPGRVIGGPDWMRTAKYDINATTSVLHPTYAQYQMLLKSLLIDRFRLVVHRETRSAPAYDLVVARSDGRLGPNLRPFTSDCEAARASGKPLCTASMNGQETTHTGTGMTLRTLLAQFSRSVDRRIIDRTGLTGLFSWELRVQADPNDTTAPSIFTALQEQLGLKLEASTAPLEVVVIDHIEPPTPN